MINMNRDDSLFLILNINVISAIIFMTFFPLIRDSIVLYLESQNIVTIYIDKSILPGIESSFDYLGLISFLTFCGIVLILNLVFYQFTNKKGNRKKAIASLIAIPISVSIYTLIFLIIPDLTIQGSILEIYSERHYTMIPLIFIYIWSDFLLFYFLFYNKMELTDQMESYSTERSIGLR